MNTSSCQAINTCIEAASCNDKTTLHTPCTFPWLTGIPINYKNNEMEVKFTIYWDNVLIRSKKVTLSRFLVLVVQLQLALLPRYFHMKCNRTWTRKRCILSFNLTLALWNSNIQLSDSYCNNAHNRWYNPCERTSSALTFQPGRCVKRSILRSSAFYLK